MFDELGGLSHPEYGGQVGKLGGRREASDVPRGPLETHLWGAGEPQAQGSLPQPFLLTQWVKPHSVPPLRRLG